jgi:translation elongation factor EF-G
MESFYGISVIVDDGISLVHFEIENPNSTNTIIMIIMGDITKRRGRVIGMEPGKITAEVPVAQMHSYAIDLRAITRGQGEFTFNFERYEQAPSNIAEKIIAESKQ